MSDSSVVAVRGDWLVRADRAAVYAIVSDFEHMPENFPKVARAMRLIERDGDVLTLVAEAASFGALFPSAKIEMTATLLPGRGYRCTTHNLTFDTTGEEELLLDDDPAGTRIRYTYFVTVRRRWLRPVYAWLVATFGLPYWKRSFVDPLESLVARGQDGVPVRTIGKGAGLAKNMRVRIALLCWTIGIAIVSLVPATPTGASLPHIDKVGHFLAYVGLAILACLGFQGRRLRLPLLLGAVALGAALEFAQQFVPGRDLSLADGIVNAAGVLAGALAFRAFEGRVRRLAGRLRLI